LVTGAGETERPASLGKMPAQQRSRERVERMLQAAATVIERDGSDALRMSEVAELAGVSIGSLYQFFPDKAAIIRSLAERITVEGRACIEAELAGVSTTAGLRDAFGRLIDIYYGLFLTTPVMRDVWSATQADARLRALELEDSRANAVPLVEALARIHGGPASPALRSAAFLVMQLGEATMRLAVSVGREEGDRLVETYKGMALGALAAVEG
jgi:AcrR family transcriptional regulator